MRIAINGFGRIGRNVLRAIVQDPEALKKIDVAVINVGPALIANVAHMLMYDTLMGPLKKRVTVEDDHLVIDHVRIQLIAITDPEHLNWKKYAIDWVVDASGRFIQRTMAEKHITAGASHVLISAPAHDEDITIIMGVNQQQFNKQKHHIVSLGSCTTNAIVPMLDVLDKTFGITFATMTTIHAYTNNQALIDVESDDLRRARAAALNIVPSTTGSSTLITKILPQLVHKVTAVAIRVPVAKISLIDLVFNTQQQITVDAIHAACQKAQQGALKNIMEVINEPLVSSDFYGNAHSVSIDSTLTQAHGTVGQLFGWYDNEWGYSQRIKDFLMHCG